MIIPSAPVLGGALIRQVTAIETGVPAFEERVTVMLSTPPCNPGLKPPNESKLTNDVAFQVPRFTTAPPLLKIVNEPLPMTVPDSAVSKLPLPVTRMVLPVLGSAALCGPFKVKL